jgi:hypothetical protein
MKYVLILVISLFILPAYSQSNPEEASVNTFYGTINAAYYRYGFGGDGHGGYQVNMSHESRIWMFSEKSINSMFLKLNYGWFQGQLPEDDISGHDFSSSVIALTGKNKNHLELGLGIHYNIFKTFSKNRKHFAPHLNIGYRKQTLHSKGGVFRIGIGYPELLYMSFGSGF